MNKQLTLVPITISQKLYSTEKARLYGSRLTLARLVWVSLIMLIIAFFFANIPAYFEQLHTQCLYTFFLCPQGTHCGKRASPPASRSFN